MKATKFSVALILLTILFVTISHYAKGQNNCPATQICGPTSNTPNGFGVQELNAGNDGCLSGEHNSTWYTVTILTSGTLQFTINPNVNSNDFDYGVWGPNSPCPPTAPPIRCSYAVQAGNGNTGLGNGAIDQTEGVFGDQWTQELTVVAGQTYLIMVDNFTTNSGFNLSFGGTASLDCAVLPVQLVEFNCAQNDSGQIISWTTASETNNWKFQIEASTDGIYYEVVGVVYSPNPNSSQSTSYRFINEIPSNGDTYYRLKQIDFNGDYEYFGPIVCFYENTTPITIEYYDLLGQRVDNPTGGVFIQKITKGNSVKYTKIFR